MMSMTLLYVFLALLVLACIPVVVLTVRTYLRYRGTRVVTCPETKEPVAVRVNKRHAAATTAAGDPDLRLESCTRWPEREHCGQECLAQIEAAPKDCLVANILANWYRGASCALCGQEFGPIHWGDNRPALLSPERTIVEWDEIPPEKLPATLNTHARVCWNCLVAKTFHDRYPDLVTERKARPERRAS